MYEDVNSTSEMLTGSGNDLATAVLGRLANHYNQEGIEEVAINRPGHVWRKLRGGAWQEFPDPSLTYDYCRQICVVLSNINSQRFSEDDMPITSCELPGQPFRFQAIMGQNVKYELTDRKGVAFAVRSLRGNANIKFANYGLTPGAKIGRSGEWWFDAALSEDLVEQLAQAVGSYQSILVSGATSTGKTTFLDQLIQLIDEKKRIVTVEDAREVTVPHQNRVHLVVPRNRGTNAIGYNQILDALVRMTPEYVICGELGIYNAQPIFSLMGKGHPVFTTVHSSSPEEAMRAFVNNMASANVSSGISAEAMIDTLEGMIGCIVQLSYQGGRRFVSEIVFPSRDRTARLAANRQQGQA